VLSETIVLSKLGDEYQQQIPPPSSEALLPDMVTFSKLRNELLLQKIPPPKPEVILPDMVTLSKRGEESLLQQIPPPHT